MKNQILVFSVEEAFAHLQIPLQWFHLIWIFDPYDLCQLFYQCLIQYLVQHASYFY
jgi:hypothetical protein